MCFEYQSSSVITWLVNLCNQIQLREHASYSYCARSWCQQTNPSRKNNFPWGSKCYKTIDSYVSCVFIEIWSTWEVWRALKKLELLSASPRATLTHLLCSPNFPHASYLDERMLTYEPIVKDALSPTLIGCCESKTKVITTANQKKRKISLTL